MGDNRNHRFTPLFVALGIVVGILIGSFYTMQYSWDRLNIINASNDKMGSLLHIIDDQYVDSVDIGQLVEKSLPLILKELDPHSAYIPADEVEESMQDLKGSFSGIGIQFMAFRDTARVVRVLPGGPSEGVGLKAGDRIVSIDGQPYVGSCVTADSTRARLLGPAGTNVRLGVVRQGHSQPLTFTIARGEVPLKSVETAYMVDETTGYIRITGFGETTYAEFLAALATLGAQHFENLIIDLRGNLGGYMAPAIQIAGEFLPKNSLIVYTEGRKALRQEYRSDGRGSYQTMPLIVLVDESTASSSEIFAGAIQDNDRGTIIGRRTFGKGLVQIPIEFNDGSMLRITKARYYTPSGRCLQKPYTPGDEEDYEMDLISRAVHGEYFTKDSIKTNGQVYHTRIGRPVYGGGGIIPDVFVPRDTTGFTSYYREAYMRGTLNEFVYAYIDSHRTKLSGFTTLDALAAHLERQDLVEKFAVYGAQHGLKRRGRMLRTSHALIESYIFADIIGTLLGPSAQQQYANRTDSAVADALELFGENRAFPRLAQDEE